MNQQIKKWFILPGDYASPACNKNKAICVSIQKHNTLIINKYQNVHFCHTRVYNLDILKCTILQNSSQMVKKAINDINKRYICRMSLKEETVYIKVRGQAIVLLTLMLFEARDVSPSF